LSPDKIRPFLFVHLAKKNDDPYARQMIVYRFFLQAGWMKEAEEELKLAIKSFPGKKSELEELQDGLNKILAAKLVADLEKAASLGQHGVVRAGLARLDAKTKGRLEGPALLKVAGAEEQVRRGRQEDRHSAAAIEVAVAQGAGIHQGPLQAGDRRHPGRAERGHVGRLELFLSTARGFEQAVKDGKEAGARARKRCWSFAVTGWVLGNTSAEENSSTARNLWAARELLRKYLKTDASLSARNCWPLVEERKWRGGPVGQGAAAAAAAGAV